MKIEPSRTQTMNVTSKENDSSEYSQSDSEYCKLEGPDEIDEKQEELHSSSDRRPEVKKKHLKLHKRQVK